MEKQKQAAETEESLYTAMADDRLTQLPIHILHHILCFLSQKEALRTCLLSKQWRHIGSTRPNLEFSERFDNTQEKSVTVVTVVNRILQGFCDQNLSVHQLRLEIRRSDLRPVTTLLEKWIPMIPAFNIKVLKLNILFNTQDLPSAIFLAESLEELHLCNCRLCPVESVRLKSLRALTLEQKLLA
ncbi:F-box/LRR-repeat protein [Striga hermonthica]|uniref:F-box/LRR-repeat protein n=1 Tax=Striga hermonthica TaxID=68872 RepID=A0A9N7NPU9_STRHE|nr:F-box/LRR-repeat protein [Striga hermonthica]